LFTRRILSTLPKAELLYMYILGVFSPLYLKPNYSLLGVFYYLCLPKAELFLLCVFSPLYLKPNSSLLGEIPEEVCEDWMQFLNTFLPSIRDWESWEDKQPTAAAPGPFIKLVRKKNPPC
jgi:hypothetical protein